MSRPVFHLARYRSSPDSLRDAGARRISAVEGSVCFTPDDPGTRGLFELLGYDKLAERYDLDLTDLLDSPFEKRTIGNARIRFTAAALEADVLIDLPVLKTHNQTMLSAGLALEQPSPIFSCRPVTSAFSLLLASLHDLLARRANALGRSLGLGREGIYCRGASLLSF